MPPQAPVATLIGDVVASRAQTDRRSLQQSVLDVLTRANAVLRTSQPIEPTIGDEFQGTFLTIAAAARASLVIRLWLLDTNPGTDSRYGLGYGQVDVFDAARAPVSQDGPGWWSARSAIDTVKRRARSAKTSFARTAFDAEEDPHGDPIVDVGAVEAFLLCRDAMVDRMTPRSRRLLTGLITGRSQAELAESESITQSAVSQSLHRNGAYAIDAAHSQLERVFA